MDSKKIKKIIRIICLFSLVALIFPSCKNGTAKVARVETREAKMAADEEPRISASSFLFRHVSPRKIFGAYGYVIFTNKEDSERHESFCESFLGGLPNIEEYSHIVNKKRLMVTYWMLNSTMDDLQTEEEDFSSSDFLVRKYDYARANEIASSISLSQAKGPILVAWEKPYELDVSSRALVLDLSYFAEEDFSRAIGLWKKHIESNPIEWESYEILADKFKENLRSLLQKYGDKVSNVIKTLTI